MSKSAKKGNSAIERTITTIGLWGLIVCFLFGIGGMYFHIKNYQQNIVGYLHKENPELAKEYLYALFEPVSPENVIIGAKAVSEFGIMSAGNGDIGSALGMDGFLVGIGFCGAFMVILLGYGLYLGRQREKLTCVRLEERIKELELQRLEEDYLDEQNKRIQNFIENVAHQIKTPISRVFSSLYIIGENLETPLHKARLQECYAHLDSVNALMKRLTDIGRLEAGKVIFQKEQLDIKELLEDVVNCCGADGKVVTECAGDKDIKYYGDYEWLAEALKNIVKNGLEHDKSELPMEITCVKREDEIKIVIRDHGPGLRQKDIPNLFDRFYIPEETKANHTGIGLNLAKLIIEGHFGTIYVYNHAEGGAVFNIILPLYSLKTGKHAT